MAQFNAFYFQAYFFYFTEQVKRDVAGHYEI